MARLINNIIAFATRDIESPTAVVSGIATEFYHNVRGVELRTFFSF